MFFKNKKRLKKLETDVWDTNSQLLLLDGEIDDNRMAIKEAKDCIIRLDNYINDTFGHFAETVNNNAELLLNLREEILDLKEEIAELKELKIKKR